MLDYRVMIRVRVSVYVRVLPKNAESEFVTHYKWISFSDPLGAAFSDPFS